MFIRQISVFVENRMGAAYEILNALSAQNINIRALSVADTSDYGIMRLIVDDPDKALKVMQDLGVPVKCTDVLAVPMNDQPGGLAEVMGILRDAGVSVEYMYAFVGRTEGRAGVVFKTDNGEKAAAALEAQGIKLG